MKRVTIDLDENLYRRLKVHCAMTDQRIAEVLRKLIEQYLEKIEGKSKK
jgi:predicted DNA-binding protein